MAENDRASSNPGQSGRQRKAVARLDSFKNPQPRPLPHSKGPRSTDCPNPECNAKNSGVEEDGKSICRDCGTVIQELNMVSELVYGLTNGGAHVVHGYHVGADQAFASRGDVVNRDRMLSSQDQTIQAGHRYIVQIGVALGMNNSLRDSGDAIFRLAIGGFIQGRRIRSVAAVALYIACRIQKSNNQYMLIDFADVLDLNVFNLGHVYGKLLDHMRLNGNGIIVQPINPEDLILRFAQRLEFGDETMRVAKDAVRIVQRMNRDWMTPGRRPAGICGAALILAARMNNFRRTVREVVYVVKVQEQTLFNRLEEFKATESSGLTVEEFRTIDLERTTDPPAFTQAREPKKKRGRKRKVMEFDDDGDNDLPTVISSRASSAIPPGDSPSSPPATEQQAHQGMPPPPIPPPPIDPSLLDIPAQSHADGRSLESRSVTESIAETEAEGSSTIATPNSAPSTPKDGTGPSVKIKRGRPPKKPLTPPATQKSHPVEDTALEADITAALTDPLNFEHATALHTALESAASPSLNNSELSPEPRGQHAPIPDTEEISESEFADDPEVSNCLLTPEEVAVKTRIWTHDNRDYLRAQAAKLLKQQLAEANGTARVIVKRKRRRKRMGDMTDYVGEDAEGTPVAGSPAEAVMAMMGKRSFSKKLNYDLIRDLYATSSSAGSRRGSDSILAGSPGSGVDMGAVETTTPGGTTPKQLESPTKIGSNGAAMSAAGDAGDKERQKELESIAGELDDGIDDDASEEDEEIDDDPYTDQRQEWEVEDRDEGDEGDEGGFDSE